jgi:hypothetical protein
MFDSTHMKFPVAIAALMTLSLFAADIESKFEQPFFHGATIFARGSNRKTVLFKMKRTISHDANHLNVLREFTYPDGKVATREHVTYQGNNLVACEQDEPQIDSKGTAKVVRDGNKTKLVLEYIKGGKRKTSTENYSPDMLNNDMMGPFLLTHWKEIANGQTVKFRYISFSRTETIGFEFTKERDAVENGKPVVIVKMTPSSAFIAAFVDPLIFTIQKDAPYHVLAYDGRTPLKIKQGDKFKELDALTVFE